MVERLNGIEEVSGSNPLGSTPPRPALLIAGGPVLSFPPSARTPETGSDTFRTDPRPTSPLVAMPEAEPTRCKLCQREVAELTLEHIPPQSTGNRNRVRVEAWARGRVTHLTEPDGISLRVLCERCNSRIGCRLGTGYAEFSKQVRRSGRIGMPNSPRVFVRAQDVFPQRVLRQLYLSYICLASPEDESVHDGLRTFVEDDHAPLPDDAPRVSLYHNASGTFRVAQVSAILAGLGANRRGWRWFGAELVHPGLGAIYTIPDEGTDGSPPGPPFLSQTVDVTNWSEFGYKDRVTVELELPSWRVEHPHPLGMGRPVQVERWSDREHLAIALTQKDDSTELLRSSGSVLWRGR